MAGSRLGLKTAGRECRALVSSFSDSLLADEVETFDRIDTTLAVRLVTARAEVRRAVSNLDDVTRLRSNSTSVAKVVALHTDAIRVSRGHVARLSGIAHDKGLSFMEKELRLCERTFGSKMSGVTSAAMPLARDVAALHVDRVMAAYDEAVIGLVTDFERELRFQIGKSTDADSLERRLFWPTPAGLRGFGGRGIWWRTSTDLKYSARSMAIELAAAVRTEAMFWWNDEALAR